MESYARTENSGTKYHRSRSSRTYSSLKKRRRRRKRIRILKRVIILALIAAAAVCLIFLFHRSGLVKNKLTVEAGSAVPAAEDFLADSDKPRDISFVTDASELDTSHVGEYPVTLIIGSREYESALVVEDTVAPVGTGRDISVNLGDEVTEDELLESIDDATDVTYAFQEEPDLSSEGIHEVHLVLTDEGGNTGMVTAHVTVVVDTEPPVIEGVMTLSVFLGDAISYKSGITVTDNIDEDVDLTVDTSQVDMDTPGRYEITYIATDHAGNSTSESTYLTISEKPENNTDEETVLAMAQEVLDEITTEDMTKKQIAKAIYNWCNSGIVYVDSSEKDSWTNGAYQGFTKKSGDCFIYFSTAKALLTQADIPNIDIVKSDTSHSSHYWSLVDVGDGWYHFDTTPRKGDGDYFFLVTDAELEAYSSAHNNSHIFDHSLYPATPTVDSTID